MRRFEIETLAHLRGIDRLSAHSLHPQAAMRPPKLQLGPTIILLAMFISGCASLDEPGFQIPHGTPISQDQIPDDLRTKLWLPTDASVERYGDDPDTAWYRIEYSDGTVTTIGPDGKLHGVLM